MLRFCTVDHKVNPNHKNINQKLYNHNIVGGGILIRILADWRQNDILLPTGPELKTRRKLHDFVTEELRGCNAKVFLCEKMFSNLFFHVYLRKFIEKFVCLLQK